MEENSSLTFQDAAGVLEDLAADYFWSANRQTLLLACF